MSSVRHGGIEKYLFEEPWRTLTPMAPAFVTVPGHSHPQSVIAEWMTESMKGSVYSRICRWTQGPGQITKGLKCWTTVRRWVGNKDFMIWGTVSSWSCFCWQYRASPSLAAKNIINLISVLTIWWCPCVESSLVLLEEGVCYDQCNFLAKLY